MTYRIWRARIAKEQPNRMWHPDWPPSITFSVSDRTRGCPSTPYRATLFPSIASLCGFWLEGLVLRTSLPYLILLLLLHQRHILSYLLDSISLKYPSRRLKSLAENCCEKRKAWFSLRANIYQVPTNQPTEDNLRQTFPSAT